MSFRPAFCSFILALLLLAAPSEAAEFNKFGIASVDTELSTHEAGAHPDFSTKLVVKTDPNSPAPNGDHAPYAALKDVIVELPPGLIGDLNSVDRCANVQFVTAGSGGAGCPFSSQVGISEVRIRGSEPGLYAKAPIFNLETSGDKQVARLGFMVVTVPVFINVQVRSNSDYGVTAEVTDLTAISPVISVTTTLWGVPADDSHDTLRFTGQEVLESKQESPPRSAGHALAPFLSNPTTCGIPLEVGFEADSYQEPGNFVRATSPLGEITGCDGLDFAPSFSLLPTNREASSPTGADAELTVPQHEGYDERITSSLRDAIVRLPEGMAVSPGAADGLTACTEEEVGFHVSPPAAANCPDASKLGTAEIDSPSLERPIKGAVYQRTPAPGHLTRAWLVADEMGVHLKIPGEFQLNPVTGQITSLFLETPQVPLRSLKLHFFGGSRGVLATPRSCGVYQTEYKFTPWSGQSDAQGATPLTIDQNCDTGGFSPLLRAGTANPTAGVFSALVTTLSQTSGEQNLSRLSITMPPGVLAKLKGVTICPDDAAASGSCPDGSLIGHSTVATGFGPNPLWIPQPGKSPTAVYLGGPYQGAPYSLVVKTPAEAGPFDLGDVVVRVALQVDSTTTQVTAVSDPLPQILEGIPVSYRDIRIELDRPEFAINPTDCDPMQVSGSASSINGATASLADRFQVGGCEGLSFKPKLALRLRGGTKRADNPALSATLRMPQRGANIAWTRVTLPRSVQIDNAHINNPCTRVQFAASACPSKSILGRAKAFTPLLDQPLEGPIYFRSNGGERELPDIVADLNGPIHVILVGFIDAKRARIRTTFANVPDAPVSKFQINMFGGKRGLLENNRNLCNSTNRALLQFNGQNGKIADSQQAVRLTCKKKRR
jgi:hypothetical protein